MPVRCHCHPLPGRALQNSMRLITCICMDDTFTQHLHRTRQQQMPPCEQVSPARASLNILLFRCQPQTAGAQNLGFGFQQAHRVRTPCSNQAGRTPEGRQLVAVLARHHPGQRLLLVRVQRRWSPPHPPASAAAPSRSRPPASLRRAQSLSRLGADCGTRCWPASARRCTLPPPAGISALPYDMTWKA